jgi:hypothetical protein
MGKRPDYNVLAMNKATNTKGKIGVAWKNDDGSFNIVLNAFVSLHASADLVIRVFPNNKDTAPLCNPTPPPWEPQLNNKTPSKLNDEIPF